MNRSASRLKMARQWAFLLLLFACGCFYLTFIIAGDRPAEYDRLQEKSIHIVQIQWKKPVHRTSPPEYFCTITTDMGMEYQLKSRYSTFQPDELKDALSPGMSVQIRYYGNTVYDLISAGETLASYKANKPAEDTIRRILCVLSNFGGFFCSGMAAAQFYLIRKGRTRQPHALPVLLFSSAALLIFSDIVITVLLCFTLSPAVHLAFLCPAAVLLYSGFRLAKRKSSRRKSS